MNDNYHGDARLETSASELLVHARSLVRKTAEELETVTQDLIGSCARSSRILFITDPAGAYASLISQLVCGRGMSLDIMDKHDQNEPENVYERLAALKYNLLIPSNLEVSPLYIPTLVSHAREKHSTLKILVISGWDSPGFVQDLTTRGIHDYVPLPVRPADLQERIFRLLPRCPDQEDKDNCSLHPHND
jgi:DNA-binding response OmpR family regulator